MTENNKLSPENQALADKLTPLQRRYVINMVSGKMSQRQAYLDAGGKAETVESMDASASEILSNHKVRAFYDALTATAANAAIMTRSEAMEVLSRIARTTVKDVATFSKMRVGEDEEGEDVLQSVWEMKDSDEIGDNPEEAISELSAGRDGLKFKMYSKIQAINELAKLQGWEAPIRSEIKGQMVLMEKKDYEETREKMLADDDC